MMCGVTAESSASMNPRPSTSMFAISHSRRGKQSARSLRWRFLSLRRHGAPFSCSASSPTPDCSCSRSPSPATKTRASSTPRRSRSSSSIASSPSACGRSSSSRRRRRHRGGQEGHRASRARKGLPRPLDRCSSSRCSRDRARSRWTTSALRYLNDLLPKLDIAEVMLTDEFGYNAVTTSLSSDFVQSDEAWWQSAWANGDDDGAGDHRPRDAAHGRRAGGSRSRSRQRARRRREGEVRPCRWSTRCSRRAATAAPAMRVDLVDSRGKVIASSGAPPRFKPLSGVLDRRPRAGRRQRLQLRSADSIRRRGVGLRDERRPLARRCAHEPRRRDARVHRGALRRCSAASR